MYTVTGEPLPPNVHILRGPVTPWFEQPGEGVQYRFADDNNDDVPISVLIRSGYLAE